MQTSKEKDFNQLVREIDENLKKLSEIENEEILNRCMSLKESIEQLNAYILKKLIRIIKYSENGSPILREIASDPEIYAILLKYGIVKPDINTKVIYALEKIKPYMKSHGGDVELVKIEGDTVYVALKGACTGCSSSMTTLKEGIEKIIKETVPEIKYVRAVPYNPSAVSFHIGINDSREELIKAIPLKEIWGKEISRFKTENVDVILINYGGNIYAYKNSCAHLGLGLENGHIENSCIVCPHHGFKYRVETGECVNVPHVQLEPVKVVIKEDTIWLKV